MTANNEDPIGVAHVVAIEVNGRQRYLFESDKLQEMLGASRIVANTVSMAHRLFTDRGLNLFQPVSGEIRVWSTDREKLLDAAWEMRRHLWLQGVEHTAVYFKTRRWHFEDDRSHQDAPSRDDDVWGEPSQPSLSWVHRAITARVSRRKGSKTEPVVPVTCSQFASCQLHPRDSATHWDPLEPETRRQLRGTRAYEKYHAWNKEKRGDFFETLAEAVRMRFECWQVEPPKTLTAQTFNDLADEDVSNDARAPENKFLAFVCADGDGLGKILPDIDWNAIEIWPGATVPWRRNADFAHQLDRAFRWAFCHAAAAAMLPNAADARTIAAKVEQQRHILLPMLLQLLGGDDLWMVVRKDLALPMAAQFSMIFRNIVNGDAPYEIEGRKPSRPAPADTEMIRAALDATGAVARPVLSISLGIAFAKAGYPVWAMIQAAESLMAGAKTLRKRTVWGRTREPHLEHGCLDWHWIESSVSETIRDARSRGWSYRDGNRILLLTTRPWAAESTLHFIRAAKKLRGVARRKRELLEEILRLGYEFSLIAWERWWKTLTKSERDLLEDIRHDVKRAGVRLLDADPRSDTVFQPWAVLEANPSAGEALPEATAMVSVSVTPFLDLLSLDDMLTLQKDGPTDEHEAEAVAAGEEGQP